MYFPIIELIEKSIKDLCCWFFVTCLFCTRELQCEVKRYFETGQTNFRYFEWLNLARMKALYPNRWKIVLADFAGAYAKLTLLGIIIILLSLYSFQSLT